MPIEVEKRVVQSESDPVVDTVSQTKTSVEVPTQGEVAAARAEHKANWVWYVVGIVDALLALRLLFHLLGARNVGFAHMLYQITDPLAAPFKGIFPNPAVDRAYFDTAALVAIIVYALVGWALVALIELITHPKTAN